MVARKSRVRVVLDTNVFVRNFKSRNPGSANRRVVRLWLLEKRLQLVVSEEIVEEYLEIFAEIVGMDMELVSQWRRRFTADRRCTLVCLSRRYLASRDPDDNLMLATAHAGKAQYLLTNDRDLLDVSEEEKKRLSFLILTPLAFVREFEE